MTQPNNTSEKHKLAKINLKKAIKQLEDLAEENHHHKTWWVSWCIGYLQGLINDHD